MKTELVFPPLIKQKFIEGLLCIDFQLADTKEKLWNIYLVCKFLKEKKIREKDKFKKFYCNWLEQRFLEIYGRIEKKEKELEGTPEDPRKRFMYYIHSSYRTYRNIFERLRKKTNSDSYIKWRNDAI